MPLFYFKALTRDGDIQEGEIHATDQQAALDTLQANGKIPLSAEPADSVQSKSSAKSGVRANSKAVAQFTQELMYMLQAGIPLDRALDVLEQQKSEIQQHIPLGEIHQALRSGKPFSQTLSPYPKLFPPFYLSLIEAAEVSGDLADGLTSLNRYMESSRQLKEKLTAALIYPTILALVSLLSIIIILLYVIPQFADILADMQQTLPFHTQLILDMSQGLQESGTLLLLILGISVLALNRLIRLRAIRLLLDRLKLALPLIGPLLIRVELARFSRSLGTLLCKGVPLLQSLQIAHQTLQLAPLQTLLSQCSEALKDGQQLSPLLQNSPLLPAMMTQLIRVGEETGQLGPMLLRLAEIYEQQTETRLRKMISILEPLLIITLGLIIALLVLSMLSAIIGINNISF